MWELIFTIILPLLLLFKKLDSLLNYTKIRPNTDSHNKDRYWLLLRRFIVCRHIVTYQRLYNSINNTVVLTSNTLRSVSFKRIPSTQVYTPLPFLRRFLSFRHEVKILMNKGKRTYGNKIRKREIRFFWRTEHGITLKYLRIQNPQLLRHT